MNTEIVYLSAELLEWLQNWKRKIDMQALTIALIIASILALLLSFNLEKLIQPPKE